MTKKYFTYFILIINSIFIIFPIFWMISISFRHNGDIFSYPVKLLPPEFTLEAYIKVLSDKKIMTYFFNSYFNGIVVTLISTFIGIMAAYAVSRYNFKGKYWFNSFVISTQSIPQVILIIPFFILMVAYNLYDTRTGLLSAFISFALPYTIVMLVGYFNSISKELDEAARIDGASELRTLWTVLVPIARPGIVSTMIYTFILVWNEYILTMTLIRDDALKTFPIGIALLKGEAAYDWNVLMTMSLLASVPVLILYLFGQKEFIGGIGAGAIKG
ncbi:carbohydrate ABC transporter permease [Candidatus Epulonipiscium viviparus]|uniref:carbohydrate ABC transporter permease n=2 Tax=Candidatus Epulonipiscium viviparus TaxID=420336 RepID=UPI0027380ECB|nr:carbohydrate ABC transporter permease [Candidatus Epulopiscium viviparus]